MSYIAFTTSSIGILIFAKSGAVSLRSLTMKSIFKTLFPYSNSPGEVPIFSERFPWSRLKSSTVLGLFLKLSGN